MHDCLIAFGSNEGNSNEVFEQAIKRISGIVGVQLVARSKPLQTKPVGGPAGQGAYLNAVIRIETSLEPSVLHRELIRIEADLGRERRERWGARKIDLDLLIYSDVELETETLTLPHPRMSFRQFVIEPANEIAGDMVHATSGQTIGQLARALDQRGNLVLLVSPAGEFVEQAKIIERLLPPDWKFEKVSDEASLSRFENKAKLVCFAVDRTDENQNSAELDPLAQKAISFPGPTLRLPEDLKRCETEIKAAFEAIEPLR